MQSMQATINPRLLTKASRLFTGTQHGRIIEILQNARRAGATKVEITNDEPFVTPGGRSLPIGLWSKSASSAKPTRLKSFAYVRLFRMPECVEHGTIATTQLRRKSTYPETPCAHLGARGARGKGMYCHDQSKQLARDRRRGG